MTSITRLLLIVAAAAGCMPQRSAQRSVVSETDTWTGAAVSPDIQTLSHEYGGREAPYRLRSFPPVEGAARRPLLVFFHGNLGSNFGPKSIAPTRILSPAPDPLEPQKTYTLDGLALEPGVRDYFKDFVLLAILVPTDSDRDYQDGKVITWGSVESPLSMLAPEVLDFHADYAKDLIDKVVAAENVDTSRVYLVGQSGGSLFLANTYIPRFAAGLRGAGILLCGAEPPRPEYKANLTSDFVTRFPLYVRTTIKESDHIQPLIEKAMLDYTATRFVDGNGKHCKFTQSQPAIIERVLRNLDAQVGHQ